MAISWVNHQTHIRIRYGNRECAPIQLFKPSGSYAYEPLVVNYFRANLCSGKPVEIITQGITILHCTVESLSDVSNFEYENNHIRFVCSSPGDYVVKVNGAFALFLFIDEEEEIPAKAKRKPIVVADNLSGQSSDTERTQYLQKVIDDAAQQKNGAIVRIPEGCFSVATIEMRSGVYLHIPEQSILRGTTDRSLYPVDEPARGLSIGRCRLIHFFKIEDSGIFGRGVIDGNGFHMRHQALLVGKPTKRVTSNLIRIHRCENIFVQDIILRDSEFWNTHVLDSEHIRFRNIKLINEIPPRKWNPQTPDFFWNNADGINPDATHDMEVDGLFAYCGDDCLPVKNTGNARDPQRTTANIRFRRCTLISETTVTKIGTETCSPAFQNILFDQLLLLDGGSPFGILVRDGATINHVTIRNMRALRMGGPVYLITQPRKPEQKLPAGRIQNLYFEETYIEHAADSTATPVDINLQRESDLQNVRCQNLTINGKPYSFEAILK